MQREVIAFLSTPEAYGAPSGPIDRIDTHISIVWLVGDRAFKLKREVQFDYVDFSTVERRRVACEAEVRLNRRTAPTLYLGVRAITRQADGALVIGGSGETVDWLVEMRRFDQDALLDRLAERGRLDPAVMEPLAAAIIRLHAAAAVRTDHGGRGGMTWVVDGNDEGLTKHGRGILDAAACARLAHDTRAALSRQAARLEARRLHGLVRECHGDLHLRNICLLDGMPTIFDGVEFNDDISCVDVLYDFAFLLMDLWRRNLRSHANAVFNAYLHATTDLDALSLLPLFLSCRAAVRAKTSVTAVRVQPNADTMRTLETSARVYLALAKEFLRPRAPRLIAIGGFSGSGKSTLARALAPDIGAAPGALILRSDVIRKMLMGVTPLTGLAGDGYSADVTRRVYNQLVERAIAALGAGHSVIADAVFARAGDRDAIAAAAHAVDAPFTGLWIDAPRETLAMRIRARPLDPSDATSEVLERQWRSGAGAIEWLRLDGSRAVSRVLADAQASLS